MKRCWHQEVADALKAIIEVANSMRAVCTKANMPLDRCSKLIKHLERHGLIYCSRVGRRYLCRATETAYVWLALYRELEKVLPKP